MSYVNLCVWNKNAALQLVTVKSSRKGDHHVFLTSCQMSPHWSASWHWHAVPHVHLHCMDNFKLIHYFTSGHHHDCWPCFSSCASVILWECFKVKYLLWQQFFFLISFDSVWVSVSLSFSVCRSCIVEVKTVTSWRGFLSFVPQMWKKSQTV